MNIEEKKSDYKKQPPKQLNKVYSASPKNAYASKEPKLLENTAGQGYCFACTNSGQPCSKHIKADKKIVDITDLFGGVTSEGLNIPAQEKNSLYSLLIAAYVKDVADQLPPQFANVKAVLSGIAMLYLKSAGIDYKISSYNAGNSTIGGKSYSSAGSAYSGKGSVAYSKN